MLSAPSQMYCALSEAGLLTPHALPPAERRCTPVDSAGHVHGPACGHQIIPHDDHVDYLVLFSPSTPVHCKAQPCMIKLHDSRPPLYISI